MSVSNAILGAGMAAIGIGVGTTFLDSGEVIALLTALTGLLGGLVTVIFTQLRALRKEAAEHKERMAKLKADVKVIDTEETEET